MPVVDDGDAVGARRGRQTVRDHDHGPPLRQASEGALDGALRPRVEARRRLVEHEQCRIGERGPNERHELLLARRQARAALTHFGVQPVGEGVEPLGEPEGGDRVPDLLVGRVGLADDDVVAHASGEQEPLLGHDHDPLAQ